jgi:hypothetical protein
LKKINRWLVKLLQAVLRALKRNEREYTPKTQVKDRTALKKPIEVKGVNLLIIRDTFTEKSTIGKLFINGENFCDTLENPYINNERNISCIPEGQYKVRLRLSKRISNKRLLTLISSRCS